VYFTFSTEGGDYFSTEGGDYKNNAAEIKHEPQAITGHHPVSA
jgi:hypothetical protein